MKKKILSVVGTVAAVASAITLIDFKRRRNCREYTEPPVGELLFTFGLFFD